ncbi:uncharacterized protein LOC111388963 [Olea europaea var. sylvestris]|uniref:uncharacterized protein LOC111388963 n=1 Tax=Olea europaea var. sylvestris TaxID=158386 RepID=UPI000C1D87C6|nr:uncharacterized protein LOC111388963 [Olea europaea var. sylvestris]
MPFSLLTSPPTPAPRNLPTFSLASSSHLTTTRFLASKRFRTTISIVARASEEGDDKPAFNPFGFVTDNPSIRSAIQLPESPAEDGNVGQMLLQFLLCIELSSNLMIYGSYIKAGGFRWFVRETGSIESGRGTIVFLHGAPMQSYSYRVVMSQMADAGFHCFAPNWIGLGFSDKPQAGYGFDYTKKEFHEALGLGVASPFFLVVQGFLVGSYGLTWALNNPSRISKLGIMNTQLTVSSPLPGLFNNLSYVLKMEKANVYRLPYLSGSGPRFDGIHQY